MAKDDDDTDGIEVEPDDEETGTDDTDDERVDADDDDQGNAGRDSRRDRDQTRSRDREKAATDRDAAADDDPADEPADGEPWKAPTQDRWDRTVRALKKANTQAEKNRLELAALKRQSETADQTTQRVADTAALEKYKPLAVAGELKAALMAAGLRTVDDDGEPLEREVMEKRLKRITRLVDFAQIEITGDGISGLDDQIEDIQADYPELFRNPTPVKKVEPPPRPRGPRGGARADGADRKPEAEAPKSTAARIAAGLTGRS